MPDKRHPDGVLHVVQYQLYDQPCAEGRLAQLIRAHLQQIPCVTAAIGYPIDPADESCDGKVGRSKGSALVIFAPTLEDYATYFGHEQHSAYAQGALRGWQIDGRPEKFYDAILQGGPDAASRRERDPCVLKEMVVWAGEQVTTMAMPSPTLRSMTGYFDRRPTGVLNIAKWSLGSSGLRPVERLAEDCAGLADDCTGISVAGVGKPLETGRGVVDSRYDAAIVALGPALVLPTTRADAKQISAASYLLHL